MEPVLRQGHYADLLPGREVVKVTTWVVCSFQNLFSSGMNPSNGCTCKIRNGSEVEHAGRCAGDLGVRMGVGCPSQDLGTCQHCAQESLCNFLEHEPCSSCSEALKHQTLNPREQVAISDWALVFVYYEHLGSWEYGVTQR